MHKGPQKYPPETKQLARSKADAGMSLSDIARELNASKSTVKYWLDHPDDPVPGVTVPQGAGVRTQCSQAFWDVLYTALLQIKRDLRKMNWQERLDVIEKLLPYLQAISALESRGIAVPERIIEVSQEIKMRVNDFLKKQSDIQAPESAEKNLGPAAPERAEQLNAETASPKDKPALQEANRAT